MLCSAANTVSKARRQIEPGMEQMDQRMHNVFGFFSVHFFHFILKQMLKIPA